MKLPPVTPQHPLEAARKLIKKGVSVPYCLPQPSEDTNWKVAFEKPSDITLVGSWANKISVKGKDGSKFGVDLAVEMPEVSVPSFPSINLPNVSKRIYSKRRTI
jgi:U3 small nucleolar RNA-associated protein 22